MISCFLKGGLGNQMFQIAATNALALKNNDFCVFNFNNCYTPNQGFVSMKYKDNFFSKLTHYNEFNYENIYVEPKFSYTEIPYKPNLMLDGYFQSEKYFKDFEKETIDLFNFSDKDVTDVKKFLSTIKNGKKITCVHVRRGDYIKYSNYHLTCDVNFYKKSMSYFTDNNFIFISDDIVWVQENFIGDNIFYSNFNDELKDLLLLILSDNLIISNSSFSWWGAYLNKNKDKNIIVPKKWFNNAGPKDQQDIIPENWITID